MALFPTVSRRPAARPAALALLALALAPAARAQDAYFSQPFATRLHTNPAFAGLLDDQSVTLSFRNQFPLLPGTFRTLQLAADLRPDPARRPGQHHGFGALVNYDRSGVGGYTRLEASGLYSYHTRLTNRLALAAGARVGYGRQSVSYDGLTFGDQLAPDGSRLGPTAEALAGQGAANYLTLGTGAVLYTDNLWVSLAGQHLNRPDLGFGRAKTGLPILLNASVGYKLFLIRQGPGVAVTEISLTPVAAYARQGGSQRWETGLYGTVGPLTLGAVYRNLSPAGQPERQQVLAVVAGVQSGSLLLGYAYDAGLSPLSTELGGAHEITLGLRAFDKLENAFRRLKRRQYPAAPCPSF